MSAERGFTMVEIVVAAAILAGSLGVLVFWQRSSGVANEMSAREQEFANQLAMLSARVRTDLRSCAALTRPDPTTWVIRVWRRQDQGLPESAEVRYAVSGNGMIITRTGPERTAVFDFTRLVRGGKRFVFTITP